MCVCVAEYGAPEKTTYSADAVAEVLLAILLSSQGCILMVSIMHVCSNYLAITKSSWTKRITYWLFDSGINTAQAMKTVDINVVFIREAKRARDAHRYIFLIPLPPAHC